MISLLMIYDISDLHDVGWLGHQGDVVRKANVCLLATIRMIFIQSQVYATNHLMSWSISLSRPMTSLTMSSGALGLVTSDASSWSNTLL